MIKTKYRKLISEEIIEDSNQPGITAPVVKYRGDRGGDDLTFDWSCIDKPLVVPGITKVNDRDQFMLFASCNLNNLGDFGSEIEISLGPERTTKTIDEPKLVYIPRGLVYGPVNFKKIGKPIIYMNFYIAPEFSKQWATSDYAKYLVKPDIRSGVYELKSFNNGNLFREQKIPSHMMLVLGRNIGNDGANFCVFYYSIRYPHLLTEPVHAHNAGMWIINLGGDPTNVEDFDAELEYWWGEENQKIVIDSTSVSHIVPGLIHRCINYSRIGKPYIQIHAYTAPYPDKDQVISTEGGFNFSEGVKI